MSFPDHTIKAQAGEPGYTSCSFDGVSLSVCGSRVRCFLVLSAAILLLLCPSVGAQSTASIEGQITDPQSAVVPGVEIIASSSAISITRKTTTDDAGRYQLVALPVGIYSLEVRGRGFQTQVISNLVLEVAGRVTQDFQLKVGDVSQSVTVTTGGTMVESSTTSVGHVMDGRMVQTLPLNGRYFLDLGLLLPGSVTPPQGAFGAAPMRGLGSLNINTGGSREEAVNYVINGVTLNDLTFSSISFQPSISTVQEFKIDNSTFSAEHGQSSGALVNIATRSGANTYHGEVFEFLRNDALDARNFFNFTSSKPPPFRRNQFGGHLGGPIFKDKAFFFFSYEGLRQRQRLDTNSLVLSDAQRAAVTDSTIRKLIELVPRPNFFDASGQPRFVSSANAPVNADQWTVDISYNLGDNDRLHGYYSLYPTSSSEPTRTGNTIPGFGNSAHVRRQIF